MKGSPRSAKSAEARAVKKARPRNGESSTSALYRGFADALSRAKAAGGGFGTAAREEGGGAAETPLDAPVPEPANDRSTDRN